MRGGHRFSEKDMRQQIRRLRGGAESWISAADARGRHGGQAGRGAAAEIGGARGRARLQFALDRRLADRSAAARAADDAGRRRGAHEPRAARHRRAAAGAAQPGAARASGRDPRPDQRGTADPRRSASPAIPRHPRRIHRGRRAVREAGRARCSKACACAAHCGAASRSLGRTLAAQERDDRPGPAPQGRSADLDGRQRARRDAACRRAISTAGSRSRRQPKASAGDGSRCAKWRARRAATRMRSTARCT